MEDIFPRGNKYPGTVKLPARPPVLCVCADVYDLYSMSVLSV